MMILVAALSSLALTVSPAPTAIGTVAAAHDTCTATLIAPNAAVTTRSCGVTDNSVVTIAGANHAVLRVHTHASADLAVLDLATAPAATPLAIYSADELAAVTQLSGTGPGQALLVEDPIHGLVLAGLVAGDGTDIPTTELVDFRERTQREGFFSGWDAETVVVIAGIAAVGAIASEAQEAGACQGGAATSSLLGLGFALSLALARRRRTLAQVKPADRNT